MSSLCVDSFCQGILFCHAWTTYTTNEDAHQRAKQQLITDERNLPGSREAMNRAAEWSTDECMLDEIIRASEARIQNNKQTIEQAEPLLERLRPQVKQQWIVLLHSIFSSCFQINTLWLEECIVSFLL